MSERRLIWIGPGDDAARTARRWILRGWHQWAKVEVKSGPGKDIYGAYVGRWTGHAGTEWVEVTVRERGDRDNA